jgi:hypothetical protein
MAALLASQQAKVKLAQQLLEEEARANLKS